MEVYHRIEGNIVHVGAGWGLMQVCGHPGGRECPREGERKGGREGHPQGATRPPLPSPCPYKDDVSSRLDVRASVGYYSYNMFLGGISIMPATTATVLLNEASCFYN